MRRKNAILIGALAGVMMATPVLAAGQNDCLQKNRIVSWRAVDDNTLVFTDRQMKQFTVEMKNTCEFATRAGAILVYDTWQNLECLSSGQIIHVAAPGLLRSSCAVGSVHAGGPAGNAPGDGGRG